MRSSSPEFLVRRVRNASSSVTVVGEVGNSVKVPLTPSGERPLDALAAASSVRQQVNTMTVQITRGSDFCSMPLRTVIRDPRQHVSLQAGDVVTAIPHSLTFTALGSTIRNEEMSFEAQGISVAQALAWGHWPERQPPDALGVFIFRFEPLDACRLAARARGRRAEGPVPVIYNIDLRNPNSFLINDSVGLARERFDWRRLGQLKTHNTNPPASAGQRRLARRSRFLAQTQRSGRPPLRCCPSSLGLRNRGSQGDRPPSFVTNQ
jgi:polysaccharide biosynthesis/export protein